MATTSDNEDDSDGWATEELPEVPIRPQDDSAKSLPDNDDDDWDARTPRPVSSLAAAPDDTQNGAGSPSNENEVETPMILVNFTALSNGVIHSKFDANAVNDSQAVKALRGRIEAEYGSFARNHDLLANGTVVPCGSKVWPAALARLRQQHVGHYFCPIFPSPAAQN